MTVWVNTIYAIVLTLKRKEKQRQKMIRQFRLDNSPICYYISGKEHKEWLLFLHAAFVDHRMFQQQLAYFADKYNVLLLDIIGHGRSINTKKGDSIDNMSAWIYDILQKEGIAKIHLTGVSLGAILAEDFANRYPDAVSSLACFGGYDINHFDKKMQGKNAAAQMLMMIKALFSVKWFAQANKKISAYSSKAQNDFYEMNISFPKKSFRYLASLNGMVNVHETKKRNYPLLVACGEHDTPMALQAMEMWKEREPDCITAIFEQAGHCVNMDVPEAFNRVMENFYRGGTLTAPQPVSAGFHTTLY